MTTAEAFQSGQMEDVPCDIFSPVRWCHHRERITTFFFYRRIEEGNYLPHNLWIPVGDAQVFCGIWRIYLLADYENFLTCKHTYVDVTANMIGEQKNKDQLFFF